MSHLSTQLSNAVLVDVLEAAIRALPGGDAAIAAAVAALPADTDAPV